jgi:signal transduction histidine kinase/CheY-like chemotaxis protein
MPGRIAEEEIQTLRQQAISEINGDDEKAAYADATDLASALEELRIHGAELEIQNEELQLARAHAEELQKRYFRHFDLAPVGMIRLDDKGMVLEANILGAAMLGVDRLHLNSGKIAFAAHIAHGSQLTFQRHLRSALALRSPLVARNMATCEVTLRGAAGASTFVRMQTIVSCGSEDARDLLVTLIDLSEHQRLEGGLARQKDVAESATREKDMFFAMLSHELRTPLTPALMLIEELEKRGTLSKPDRDSLAVVRRNLKLEVRLIDDLLDLTRISKGKLALEREIGDIHACVRRAFEICMHGVEAKHLEFKVDLAATHHIVDADCNRLQQVFSNLIRNAIKFTSAGGCISVRSFNNRPGAITFEFTDTGIGIEPAAIDGIFDPFAQATPSIQSRFGGLGLGLAISRSLVQAHEGSLAASSAGLGRGSTFRLELPTSECAAPLAAEPPPETFGLVRRDNLRLLLVENHDDTRRVLDRLLARRGYHVETASDASSAQTLCTEKEFDAVISDIGLPDRSGLELMKEIATRHQIPGIAISGFGMDSDVAKSKAAGFEEHLTKPIDFEELDTVLQRIAHAG